MALLGSAWGCCVLQLCEQGLGVPWGADPTHPIPEPHCALGAEGEMGSVCQRRHKEGRLSDTKSSIKFNEEAVFY